MNCFKVTQILGQFHLKFREILYFFSFKVGPILNRLNQNLLTSA